MKKSIFNRSHLNIALIGMLAFGGLMITQIAKAEAPPPVISFQVFYDELTPYGDWIRDPIHGYVWVPYAEPNFQPYATNGYWVMSTYGNTWVSNYDWGWAPFHYGRWYFDDYLGWAWVPGYEWGPAWVNWRTNAGYYGWAPLGPGISIHVAVNIPSHHWVFVPKRRFISRNVYNYYVPRRNVVKIYNQTTVINNTYVYNNRTYVTGPERREVERATRRSVPVYQVNDSQRPGRSSLSRNSLVVYKPDVRQRENASRTVQERPSRVVTADEHKATVARRNTTNSNAVRTAPASSRTSSTRATDNQQVENATRSRTTSNSPARVSTNSPNTRVQNPNVNNQRSTQPNPRQRQVNPTENRSRMNIPGENAVQNRREQVPSSQKRANVEQRPTQNQRINSPARQRNAPASTNTQVRTRESQRSNSSPRVSSENTRTRSTGNTTRSSSSSRRGSN